MTGKESKKMDRMIFATSNEGKVREVRGMLKEYGTDVITMKEAGIDADIDENGTTFVENAVIKAKTVMELSGQPAIADDSGLEVDYLGGMPGIYSARYLGHDTSYDIKNAHIIDELSGVPDEKRTARYVCAMAAAFPDGEIITCEETLEGIIAREPAGENGFGYDPIVYVPEFGMTTGQMTPEFKNSISHRGKALKKMRELLKGKFADRK